MKTTLATCGYAKGIEQGRQRADRSAIIRWLLSAGIMVSLTTGARAGVILTTLYAFTNEINGVYTDTEFPQGELIFGSDGNLYGTTSGGGQFDGFGPDPNSGAGSYGSVFRISTTGEWTNLFDFISNAVQQGLYSDIAPDGAVPSGGLVSGNDGYFYGTTTFGGTNVFNALYGSGTVFKIGADGVLVVLHLFTDNDGQGPLGGLTLGSDGYFYGATYNSTLYNPTLPHWYGTLFKVDTNGVLTTLHLFTNGIDGALPLARPVQGADASFYGTASAGGANGLGTLYKITGDGTFSVLHAFNGATDGANPAASLIQSSDGIFYGTTRAGGANNWGTVFKFNTNGSLTSLHSFSNANGDCLPCAPLIQGSDGYLYGTTCGYFPSPGELAGSLFQISTNGVYTNLYSFTGRDDGWQPAGGLIQGPDGSFYGTTQFSGQFNAGTVFRLTIVPTLKAAIQVGTTFNLTWNAEEGGRYQLQYISDLSSSNWVNMGGPLTATSSTIGTTDTITNGPQRFYRLMPVLN